MVVVDGSVYRKVAFILVFSPFSFLVFLGAKVGLVCEADHHIHGSLKHSHVRCQIGSRFVGVF